MEAPEDLGLRIYETLIRLYADQMGVRIRCQIEVGGEKVEVDTSKLLSEKRKP